MRLQSGFEGFKSFLRTFWGFFFWIIVEKLAKCEDFQVNSNSQLPMKLSDFKVNKHPAEQTATLQRKKRSKILDIERRSQLRLQNFNPSSDIAKLFAAAISPARVTNKKMKKFYELARNLYHNLSLNSTWFQFIHSRIEPCLCFLHSPPLVLDTLDQRYGRLVMMRVYFSVIHIS